MVEKTREFHDEDEENISGESIGGAALINFFVPDTALIRVNTVFGYSYDIGQKRQEVDCLQGEV